MGHRKITGWFNTVSSKDCKPHGYQGFDIYVAEANAFGVKNQA